MAFLLLHNYTDFIGTDKPFSHLDIVCRTTFSLIASSSCESPIDFRIALIFSPSISDNLFSTAII